MIGMVDGDAKENYAKLVVDRFTMDKFVSTLETVENYLSIAAHEMEELYRLYKNMKWVAFDKPDQEKKEEKAMEEKVEKMVNQMLKKELDHGRK